MTVLCLGGFFRQFFFSKISVPSLFFLTLPFLSSRLVLRGQRKERDWLRGRARITRIPTILCWFTHSGVVESISETQNAWVSGHRRYMHCSALVSLDLLHGRQPAMDRIAERVETWLDRIDR